MRIALIALALLLALSQFVPWTMAALIEERQAPQPRDVVVVAPNVIDLNGSDGQPDTIRGSASPSSG